MRSPRSARAAWAPAVAALLALGACGGDEAGLPAVEAQVGDWPPGTVLAVADVPILAAEVDAAAAWVERIEPAASTPQLLRLALTNVVLPRAVARAIADPGERAEARRRAEARLAELRAGAVGPPAPDGTLGTLAEGNWKALGIQTWGVAMDLPQGAWSEVLEDVGQFTVVRRLEQRPAPVPMAIELAIDHFTFPYLPLETGRGLVERGYDELRLTIVDPAWRELVPEHYQYRMGARSP